MADLLRAGVKMLNSLQRESCSQSVTYQRGSDSVTVRATISSSRGETQLEYGVRETWEARDFLISCDDLVLDGDRVEPAEGDRIVESALNESDEVVSTETYVVLPPNEHEPAWRYSDEHRLRYRIHTKPLSTS